MNASVLKGVITLGVAVVLVCVWVLIYRRRRTLGTLLQLIGIPFLLIVALSHVCDAFGLVPSMGWGQPGSPGHYVDLMAAVVGTITVLPGLWFQRTPLSSR